MPEFAAPYWLLALLAVGPLLAFVVRRVKEGRRLRLLFASRALWARMGVRGDEPEVLARAFAAILAIVLLVVALADPRKEGGTGNREDGEMPRLIVLLDASKSMLANDTVYGGQIAQGEGHAGRRFNAAKSLAGDLIRALHGWQVGLMVFAAEPLVLSPVTTDQSALLTLLERARAGEPGMKGGSNIESALRAASGLIGDKRGAILLLSDGEELSGQARKVLSTLTRKRIRVNAVGFGSTDPIPLRLESGEILTWRGATVMTARNDALLAELARRTGGQYWPPSVSPSGVVGAPAGIEVASGLGMPTGRRQQGKSQKAGPIALALLILVADALWAARQSLGRLTRLALRGLGRVGRPARASSPARLATLGMLSLLVAGWTWPAIPHVQRGLAAYRQGEGKLSVHHFEQAARLDDSPEVRYDLGNAYHLAGNYRKSLAAYQESLRKLPSGSRLAEHAYYNLGNTYFRLADYRSAIAAYRKALAIDPRDEDALHNLALAESRLKREEQAARGGGASSDPGSQGLSVIPVPDADEAAALLARLEADERRRQAEAAQRESRPDPERETPSELARRFLEEAEQRVVRHLEKDW